MLLIPALASFAGAAQAQQQLTFASAGNSQAASIADDGSRVAFESIADLADGGDNADGSIEIFIVDSDGSDPSQLTDGPVGTASQSADISADGTRVVFVSNANPAGDNGDGSAEIFVAEADSGDIAQVTDSDGPSGIQAPSLSADGARLTFSATGDLLGDGSNGDGSREIFAVDADGDNLVQLTDGPVGATSQFADISPGGGRVAFASNANLTGGNGEGNNEIFIADSDGGGDPEQLTDAAAGQSLRPSISGDGRIAFDSSADLDGDNSDGNSEIFVVDADGADPSQLTNTAAGAATFARIAADGETVVFQSNADPVGNNGDGSSEVFVVGSDGSGLEQLTDSEAFSGQPSVAGGGESAAFQSNADLTGNNPEGNTEIFVLDPSTDGTGSGGGDNDDSAFYCLGSSDSGCSLCADDDDDSGESTAAAGRGMDPTLALLALAALMRLTGRRLRRR